MNNKIIRDALYEYKISQCELAKAMNIRAESLSRKLREELDEKEQKEIANLILSLKHLKVSGKINECSDFQKLFTEKSAKDLFWLLYERDITSVKSLYNAISSGELNIKLNSEQIKVIEEILNEKISRYKCKYRFVSDIPKEKKVAKKKTKASERVSIDLINEILSMDSETILAIFNTVDNAKDVFASFTATEIKEKLSVSKVKIGDVLKSGDDEMVVLDIRGMEARVMYRHENKIEKGWIPNVSIVERTGEYFKDDDLLIRLFGDIEHE